jgi:MFS family permease
LAASFGETFHATRAVLMLGMTGATLSSAIAAPFFGSLMDRFSIRLLMTFGAFSLGLALLALSVTTAMWQIIAIYTLLVAPAILAFGPISAPTLLSRWFVRRRGLALGLAFTGSAIGGFIFPPLLTKLIALYQWREALQLIGGFVVLGVVPAVFLLVIDRPSDRGLTPDGAGPQATPEPQPAIRHATNLAILKDLNFWLIALAFSLPMSGTAAVLSNLVPYAMDIHLTKEQAAQLISVSAALALGGKIVFAAIADRIDLLFLLAGAELLCLLAFLGYALGGSFFLVAVASGAISMGCAIAVPLWGALVARVFGQERLGSIMGTMSVIIMVQGMIAPPLFGAVRDWSGSYQAVFVIYAALIAVVTVFLSRIKYTASPVAVAEEPAVPACAQKHG